jgi:DNA-binding CsgD family transcriptional regulator
MEDQELIESEPRPTEVRISTLDDDDATRISGVLEALGYTVIRDMSADDDGPARLVWATNRLARRHKLTAREQDVLTRMFGGEDHTQIAEGLGVTKATVKWHMHNIFAKTGMETREQLLRLALQLPVGEPEHDGAVALASC